MLGRVSSLRERLSAGAPLIGTFAKLADANAGGVLAGAGLDFAIVDREHSQLSEREAANQVRWMRSAGLPALVRLPVVDSGEINRLLEAGAAGIQLSSVRRAEQVRDLLRAIHYPPRGSRSLSLAHAQAGYGAEKLEAYLASCGGDGAPLAVIQLETADSDDPLADIAAAGPDLIFVGTTDLLVDTGLDADAAERRMAAIIEAAVAAGVPWGGFAADGSGAAQLAARGARYLAVGSDVALLRRACLDAADAARKAVHV
jgi:4-hydroxy-2-oxoheptanedioate aldolase